MLRAQTSTGDSSTSTSDRKDRLIAAALEHVAGEQPGPAGEGNNRDSLLRYIELLDRNPKYVRLMSCWLLERRCLTDLNHIRPTMRHAADLEPGNGRQSATKVAPRIIEAATRNIIRGWITGRDYVRTALGVDDLSDEEIREQFAALCIGLEEWNRS